MLLPDSRCSLFAVFFGLLLLPAGCTSARLARLDDSDISIRIGGVAMSSPASELTGDADALESLINAALDEAEQDQHHAARATTLLCGKEHYLPGASEWETNTSLRERIAVPDTFYGVVDSALQSQNPNLRWLASFSLQRLLDVRSLDLIIAYAERAGSTPKSELDDGQSARQLLQSWMIHNGEFARVRPDPGAPLDSDAEAFTKIREDPVGAEAMAHLRAWRAKLDERGLPGQVRWRRGS